MPQTKSKHGRLGQKFGGRSLAKYCPFYGNKCRVSSKTHAMTMFHINKIPGLILSAPTSQTPMKARS